MDLLKGSCQCGCGDPIPCEYDPRFAIVREYERLVGQGQEVSAAELSITRRLLNDQRKRCPECRRWFISGPENRIVCQDCKAARTATTERRRAKRRTVSGEDATRKRLDRAAVKANLGPQVPKHVNAAVDAVLCKSRSDTVKRNVGTDHVAECARRPSYHDKLTKLLLSQGHVVLAARLRIAVRAAVCGTANRPPFSRNH